VPVNLLPRTMEAQKMLQSQFDQHVCQGPET
jgi:hypothetical protein